MDDFATRTEYPDNSLVLTGMYGMTGRFNLYFLNHVSVFEGVANVKAKILHANIDFEMLEQVCTNKKILNLDNRLWQSTNLVFDHDDIIDRKKFFNLLICIHVDTSEILREGMTHALYG